jgi:hypothetical protein
MGMYSTDIGIGQPLPIVLPKFCVAVWLICDVDDFPKQFTTTLTLPDGFEFFKTDMPLAEIALQQEGAATAEKILLSHVVPLAPFPLPCEGFVQVHVETELGKFRVGRLRVHEVSAGS